MENLFQLYSKQVQEYVSKILESGIVQHSDAWAAAKIYTIGGSQISSVIGKNHFTSLNQLISLKIGISKFKEDIKIWWGNLFESLIKKYVELDKRAKIIGSDIYIQGPPGTSYSPDGLGVIVLDTEHNVGGQLVISYQVKKVLFEFKCPGVRIPDGKVPVYYIPQVLYGLEIIPWVDIGLFVEGVFRRCAWEDLGVNPRYDITLAAKSTGNLPKAFGFIGFYFDEKAYTGLLDKASTAGPEAKYPAYEIAQTRERMNRAYMQDHNFNETSDLGLMDQAVFKLIMEAFSKGVLIPWYGQIYKVGPAPFNEKDALDEIWAELTVFEQTCKAQGWLNYGILPWKLFRVFYNQIERQPGFLEEHLPKIREVVEVIRECMAPGNEDKKYNIYNDYVRQAGGFV